MCQVRRRSGVTTPIRFMILFAADRVKRKVEKTSAQVRRLRPARDNFFGRSEMCLTGRRRSGRMHASNWGGSPHLSWQTQDFSRTFCRTASEAVELQPGRFRVGSDSDRDPVRTTGRVGGNSTIPTLGLLCRANECHWGGDESETDTSASRIWSRHIMDAGGRRPGGCRQTCYTRAGSLRNQTHWPAGLRRHGQSWRGRGVPRGHFAVGVRLRRDAESHEPPSLHVRTRVEA